MIFSSIDAVPPLHLEASDGSNDGFNILGRQRRAAARLVPKLHQVMHYRGIDVMAQEVARQPCCDAIAAAFVDAPGN
jgi:oligoribonuclease (3'-5' exoribonuclease)